LDPGHQVLDILRCGHFCGLLESFRVLPEVLESVCGQIRSLSGTGRLTRPWLSFLGSSGASKTR
jgi:hypothetical protein